MKATQIVATVFCMIIGFVCLGIGSGRAAEIFFDDFADGSVTNDVPVVDGIRLTWLSRGGATLDASSGDLVISSAEEFGLAEQRRFVLSDTSIRTQVRLGTDGFIFVQARRSPISGVTSTYNAALFDNGTLFLTRNPSSNDLPVTVLGTVSSDLDPSNEDVILQLDVIASTLSFWAWRPGESMPNRPQLSVTDDNIASGLVALAVNTEGNRTGIFRYVRVADTHIPEPSSVLMAVFAVVGFMAFGRRRRIA